MNSLQLIDEIRIRIGDLHEVLDAANVDYSTEYLFKLITSALNSLVVTSVIEDDTYTISGVTITPNPSTIDGLLLATKTVVLLLGGDLSASVRSGELGIRFRSGVDEISTIEAAKRIDSTYTRADAEFRGYIIAKIGSKTTGAYRLQ